MDPFKVMWVVGIVLCCGIAVVLSWRIEHGPYGWAWTRIPLLCRASTAPRRPETVPAWVEPLVTMERQPCTMRLLGVCVLPDLLGGRAEAVFIQRKGASRLVVRCPRVRPPRDLTRGTIVAGDPFLLPGKAELDALAAVPLPRSARLKITIFLRRGTGAVFQPDETSQHAIAHAFDRGFFCGLSSVEVHGGTVFLVFDKAGRILLRPRHIAAICAALDDGDAAGGRAT